MSAFVFDLETTNKIPAVAAIIQAAFLRFDDTVKIETPEDIITVIAGTEINNFYFVPPFKLSPMITKITGLNNKFLEAHSDGISWVEGYEDVSDLLTPGTKLIGHNIEAYDCTVLYHQFKTVGLKFNKAAYNLYDTYKNSNQLAFALGGKDKKLGTCYEQSIENLVSTFGEKYSRETFDNLFLEKMRNAGMQEDEAHSHNGVFDSFMNLLVYLVGKLPGGGIVIDD